MKIDYSKFELVENENEEIPESEKETLEFFTDNYLKYKMLMILRNN